MRPAWLLFAVIGCGDNRAPAGEPALPDAVARLPTYYRDVAPILTERCAGCHVDGGVGPFALATYDDAASRSELISTVTTARSMPPWPANGDGSCNTFVDSRWLSETEINTIAAWHAAGAPAGDPADQQVLAPPLPTPFTEAVEVGASTPYLVRPGPDEYRCFVVDPALSADRYITAIAMQLDRADIVHHMQLYAADTAAGEASITAREALDPQPGYACGEEGVGSRLRFVGVWAPGDLVRRWPGGTGIRITAGHRLVMQLHYHNHGSELVADQTRVALELADTVERVGRIETAAGFPLNLSPHEPNVTVSSDVPLQGSGGMIRGGRIHMHALGTRGRMELVRDGETACVLDIPRWDVGWQLFYSFAQPIPFAAGDRIRISCSYDTRSRDDAVTWGINTDDEMCLGYTFLSGAE